jgi:hypothetical protein
VKIHFFESESWIKEAWHAAGARMEAVWVQGLLTPLETLFSDTGDLETQLVNHLRLKPKVV